MSRYPGGLIRKTPVTPAGPFQNGAASGVWTLAEAAFWTKQGLWPIAGNVADGTFAVFALGQAGVRVTTRNKYTYSGDVVSAGGAATVASRQSSAAGNGTVGIFALGSTCCGNVTTRNKYTYVGCVVSAGGAATAASSYGSAAGNSTVGIFALGCTGALSTTRNKYTYSGCAVSVGGAATVPSAEGSAAGNSTVGIFALGCNCSTARNKYTYSGCVVSAGGAAIITPCKG